MHHLERRLLAIVAVALLLAPASGCSWRRTAWELGLGDFATDLTVARATSRGPYREATLVRHGLALDVLAPDTPACREVLVAGARVEYLERGVGGHYERDGTTCVAAGGGLRLVGSRPSDGAAASRSASRTRVTFAVLHVDEEVMLLRGRFPGASLLGWTGEDDTVIAVPNVPVCRSAIAGGVAALEARAGGRPPLGLVGDGGLCPVDALAQPPGTSETGPR